jgi:tetratricopeptide (TPR) repeat protein
MIVTETRTEFSPPTLDQRIQAERLEERLVCAFQRVFPRIDLVDIRRGLKTIIAIEERMVGRHCGDLGDKLSQYLSIVEYVRLSGLSAIDSIEIGTLFGGSALTKLSAMRDLGVQGTVVCIDPLRGFYDEDVDSISGLPVNPQIVYENLRRFGFDSHQVEIRRYLSSDPQAWAGLRAEHFGHLMIDGDHSFAGVQGDWEHFNAFVAKGGIVIFDDYADHRWPDITRFGQYLDQALDDGWKSQQQLGTSIILQKHLGQRMVGTSLVEAVTESATVPVIRPELIDSALLDLLLGDIRRRLETDKECVSVQLFEVLRSTFPSFGDKAVEDLLLLARHIRYKGLPELELGFLHFLLEECRYEGLGQVEVACALARLDGKAESWQNAERILETYLAATRGDSRQRAVAWIRKGETAKGLSKHGVEREAYVAALATDKLRAKERYRLNLDVARLIEKDGGDLAVAAAHYRDAANLDGNTPQERIIALSALGLCLHQDGNGDAARDAYSLALSLPEASSADRFRLFNRLGLMEEQAGALDKAKEYYGHAIAVNELSTADRAKLHGALSRIHSREGHWPLALEALSKAKGLIGSANEQIVHLARTLGTTVLNQGNPLAASQILELIIQCIGSSELNAEFPRKLGAMLRQRGDLSGAYHYFKKALDLSTSAGTDAFPAAIDLIGSALQSGDRKLISAGIDHALTTEALDAGQKRQLIMQTRQTLARGPVNGKG